MPDNNNRVVSLRGLLTAALVPSFYLTEWLLVGASAALFSTLRYRGLSDGQIWLLLWLGNLLLSTLFVLCNDRLQIDLTLMQGLRRLTEATIRRSGWPGLLLEAVVCIRLLIWDGPCQLLIFCRCRLPSPFLRAVFLVTASGLQMLIWARLYTLGYDSLPLLKGVPS